jgi:hypothetical protein
VSSESEPLPPRHRSSRPRGPATGEGEGDREGLGECVGEAMAVGAGWGFFASSPRGHSHSGKNLALISDTAGNLDRSLLIALFHQQVLHMKERSSLRWIRATN